MGLRERFGIYLLWVSNVLQAIAVWKGVVGLMCLPHKKENMPYQSPLEKRQKHRKRGGGVAIGGGGLVLAVFPAFQYFEFAALLVNGTAGLGLFLVVVGGSWFVWGCFLPRDSRTEEFTYRNVLPDEVGQILDFAKVHLGPVGLPTEDQLRDLLKINPKLYYVIEGRPDPLSGKVSIVGCFTILPLKTGAVRGLESGELTGASIKADHICRLKGAPKAFYIGSVIGSDFWTSVIAIKKLGQEITRLCKKHKIVTLYARPVTNDGLRLVRKRKFKNVIDGKKPEMNIVCRTLWDL